jgi:exodeoxyribonuclease-5
MSTLTLTAKQDEAIKLAVKNVFNQVPITRIGGYAGTGKTTVLKEIISDLEDHKLRAMPCAFTGKAALRMRNKGVFDASTIHSLIYSFNRHTHTWHKRLELDGDYFLIDEASMISKDLWRDIQSFDLPCILIGDIGQLEPVGDDPKLLATSDIILDEIHRQDADSGIICFATNVRLDKTFAFSNEYRDVSLRRTKTIGESDLRDNDIILCGLNKTRQLFNRRLRKLYDRTDELNAGDKIICLANNSKIGIFNGEIFTVKELKKKTSDVLEILVETCDGNTLDLPLWRAQLDNPDNLATKFKLVGEYNGKKRYKPLIMDSYKYAFCDFGYCITCHKSQGSEWDNVLVIDEQIPHLWDSKRWRYTAITRAAKKLTYIL